MLNKTIPIELIDRRLLAKNEMKEIKKAQEENIDEHATEKIAKFILDNIGIKEN